MENKEIAYEKPGTGDNAKKYEIVKRYVLKYIQEKGLGPGDTLPTDKSLTETLHVSRITILRAFQDLQEQRLIYRIQGGGTYVGEREESSRNASPAFIPFVISHHEPGNRFFELIQGAEQCLSEHSCYLTIHTTSDDCGKERHIIEQLIKDNAKCILISPRNSNQNIDFYFKVIHGSVPLVFVDIPPSGLFANLVSCDNIYGGYLATSHLFEQGYKRIAIFSAPFDQADSTLKRLNGYQLAHRESGVPLDEQLYYIVTDDQPIDRLVDKMLNQPVVPDAVFAVNDASAIQVYNHLQRRGVRVPEDIALIGFDNQSAAATLPVPLSTIDQPFHQLGYTAAKRCLDLLETQDASFQHIILPVSLVKRASTQNRAKDRGMRI